MCHASRIERNGAQTPAMSASGDSRFSPTLSVLSPLSALSLFPCSLLFSCHYLSARLFHPSLSFPPRSFCALCTFPSPFLRLLVHSLLSSPPPFLPMGRRPWASPEQIEFLERHFATLERDKQDQPLTVIYARVTASFIQQWPSPLPRGDDFEGCTPDELKVHADNFRGRVGLPFCFDFLY